MAEEVCMNPHWLGARSASCLLMLGLVAAAYVWWCLMTLHQCRYLDSGASSLSLRPFSLIPDP